MFRRSSARHAEQRDAARAQVDDIASARAGAAEDFERVALTPGCSAPGEAAAQRSRAAARGRYPRSPIMPRPPCRRAGE